MLAAAALFVVMVARWELKNATTVTRTTLMGVVVYAQSRKAFCARQLIQDMMNACAK
jgi:hypothetical protein